MPEGCCKIKYVFTFYGVVYDEYSPYLKHRSQINNLTAKQKGPQKSFPLFCQQLESPYCLNFLFFSILSGKKMRLNVMSTKIYLLDDFSASSMAKKSIFLVKEIYFRESACRSASRCVKLCFEMFFFAI